MAEPDKILAKDPKLMEILVEEFKEAFRTGPDGVTHEEKIYASPWGFDLRDISPDLQVDLWYGGKDVNVPISMGREMCKLIPNCKGYFYPDEGHMSLVFNYLGDIMEIMKKKPKIKGIKKKYDLNKNPH